jgi:hypothetical protein
VVGSGAAILTLAPSLRPAVDLLGWGLPELDDHAVYLGAGLGARVRWPDRPTDGSEHGYALRLVPGRDASEIPLADPAAADST